MPETTQTQASVSTDWLPATQQRAFRQILRAFSYPGRVCVLDSEAPSALPLLLATLVDGGIRLADPHTLLNEDDRRRLGAASALPENAQFIVHPGSCSPDFHPALGSLEIPEQGATVILLATDLESGSCLRLAGPGIADETSITVKGVDPAWWDQRMEWNASFPLGVDLMLIAGRKVVALPRTTRIAMGGSH